MFIQFNLKKKQRFFCINFFFQPVAYHDNAEVTGGDGDLLVSGASVQVMFDYASGTSKRMPDEVRSKIEAFDGPFGPGGVRT